MIQMGRQFFFLIRLQAECGGMMNGFSYQSIKLNNEGTALSVISKDCLRNRILLKENEMKLRDVHSSTN